MEYQDGIAAAVSCSGSLLQRHLDPGRHHQFIDICRHNRLTEQVTLTKITAEALQEHQLPRLFNPFGNDFQAHAVGHGDYRPYNGDVGVVVGQALDESLIDFEGIHWNWRPKEE